MIYNPPKPIFYYTEKYHDSISSTKFKNGKLHAFISIGTTKYPKANFPHAIVEDDKTCEVLVIPVQNIRYGIVQ